MDHCEKSCQQKAVLAARNALEESTWKDRNFVCDTVCESKNWISKPSPPNVPNQQGFSVIWQSLKIFVHTALGNLNENLNTGGK